jgi:hypothetical protein
VEDAVDLARRLIRVEKEPRAAMYGLRALWMKSAMRKGMVAVQKRVSYFYLLVSFLHYFAAEGTEDIKIEVPVAMWASSSIF